MKKLIFFILGLVVSINSFSQRYAAFPGYRITTIAQDSAFRAQIEAAGNVAAFYATADGRLRFYNPDTDVWTYLDNDPATAPTLAEGQIGVGNGSDLLSGDPDFTFDGTTNVMTVPNIAAPSNLTISPTGDIIFNTFDEFIIDQSLSTDNTLTQVLGLNATNRLVLTNLPTGGVSDGDKGDITVGSGGTTFTIDNDATTYAKMQNVSAASKLIGRGDSGSGDPQEITLGSGLSMSGTTLSSSGGITNSASTNELPKISGGNLVSSSIFSTSSGILSVGGSSTSGTTRYVLADGSSGSIDLTIGSKGGSPIYLTGANNIQMSDNSTNIFVTHGVNGSHALGTSGSTVNLTGTTVGNSNVTFTIQGGDNNSQGSDVIIRGGNGGSDPAETGGDLTLSPGTGTANGRIIMLNLPTSSAGLPSGALWNNSGVLSIVP